MKKVQIASILLATVLGGGVPVWAADREAAVKHLVYLNPFIVQKFAQEAAASGYKAPEVPDGLEMPERMAYVQIHLEEFKYAPGAEAVKALLIDRYQLRDVGETLSSTPAFFAQLSDKERQAVAASELVSHIDTFNASEDGLTLSGAVDQNVGGEIIPWARQAVSGGLYDSTTTANQIYVVDMAYSHTALNGEINLSFTNNMGYTPSIAQNHAAHIFSLVGARENSQKIKGINPGQPIVHIGSKDAEDLAVLISGVDYAAWLAEYVGDFASMSLSFNSVNIKQSLNTFNINNPGGRMLRKASSRFFIAQSAGNKNRDACLQAFNYGGTGYQARDGIVVTGGTDNNGARFLFTQNPAGWGSVDGSSYGPCVEAWAPGSQITSTWADGSVQTMTGTSFSAPIVAAIAARYGNYTTRPIEREAYITNSLFWTGQYENASTSNAPIMQVAYTNPTSHSIPKRLPITAAYSKTNPANLNFLYDQKFYTENFWNAGAYWGSVVVDLGSVKNITGVRLHMRSSANGGAINFAVHGGNAINLSGPDGPSIPTNPIAYSNVTNQFDMVPYYIYLSGNYRYLMIEGNNFDSWLAYSEIEVYGN